MKTNMIPGKCAEMKDGDREPAGVQSGRRFEEGKRSRRELRNLQTLARVRAALPAKRGLYDAQRLRSQRDVIRDVMLAASECGSWLTLAELRALTHYGEASISAQLRHLRKCENGGYEVSKRHREDGAVAQEAVIDTKEFTWEYRVMGRLGRPNSETRPSSITC